MERLLKEFILWAELKSPDAWWIFENPDEAIEKFIQKRGGNEIEEGEGE